MKWNLSLAFPFFSTRDVDFTGLKLIQVQVVSSSRPLRIHLFPKRDVDNVKGYSGYFIVSRVCKTRYILSHNMGETHCAMTKNTYISPVY